MEKVGNNWTFQGYYTNIFAFFSRLVLIFSTFFFFLQSIQWNPLTNSLIYTATLQTFYKIVINSFCFQCEPNDGELCVDCWKKISAFDQFYINIESVHELINKTKESITVEPVKIEIDEHSLKDERTFSDDDWSPFQNDIDESDHNSIGNLFHFN